MAVPYYGHGFYTRQVRQFLYMDMLKIWTFYTWSWFLYMVIVRLTIYGN